MEFWQLEEHEVAYSWLRADVPGRFCEDVPSDLGADGCPPDAAQTPLERFCEDVPGDLGAAGSLPGCRPDPPEES